MEDFKKLEFLEANEFIDLDIQIRTTYIKWSNLKRDCQEH